MECAIIHFLSRVLNKRLNKQEINYVQKRIKELNPKGGITPVIQMLSRELKLIQTVPESDSKVAISDYLKSNIGTSAEDDSVTEHKIADKKSKYDKALSLEVALLLKFNKETLFDLAKKISPAVRYYYTYIMLDTDNKDQSESTTSKFVWNLNDGPPIQKTGTIDVSHKIHPIVMMRLGTLDWANIDMTTYSLIEDTQNRFAVNFSEFNSQALIHPNGEKFHFLQAPKPRDYTKSATFTMSSFNDNRGWFRFHTPHNKPAKLTMKCFNPFIPTEELKVEEKLTTMVMTQSLGDISSENIKIYNPLYLNPKSAIDIKQENVTSHNEGTAASVYEYTFSGFTTDDPAGDAAIIAAYNTTTTISSAIGLHVTNAINPPTNITGVTLPGPSVEVTMTWPILPRMTGVLELVSIAPSGDKLY